MHLTECIEQYTINNCLINYLEIKRCFRHTANTNSVSNVIVMQDNFIALFIISIRVPIIRQS